MRIGDIADPHIVLCKALIEDCAMTANERAARRAMLRRRWLQRLARKLHDARIIVADHDALVSRIDATLADAEALGRIIQHNAARR